MKKPFRETWIEVNLDAVKRNIRAIRRHIPKLYGKQGNAEITVDEVAEMLGTINYEVVATLSNRIPCLFLEKGEVVEVSHLLPEG